MIPKNLCLAPFSYLMVDPSMNVSPCCSFGGNSWQFPDKSINQVWNSEPLQNMRTLMLENKKQSVCKRCWDEENIGARSERLKLWDHNIDPNGTNIEILDSGKTAAQVIESKNYLNGPLQLMVKVSNLCNLRCRSCNSQDSITLQTEGEFYQKKFPEIKITQNPYLSGNGPVPSLSMPQIQEIVTICQNLTRLEFYGGEPLLDKSMPILLNEIANAGYAKNISINISTNITQLMSESLIQTLSKYKSVNLNLSIDGWGDHFEYLRSPGKWDDVYKNLIWFNKLRLSKKIPLTLLPVITVTTMNVFYLDSLIHNIQKNFKLVPHLSKAWFPRHMNINIIPKQIAEPIASRLENFTEYNLKPITNGLRELGDQAKWQDFKFWMKIMDQYRSESFFQTFPEYTELIRKYDEFY